MSYAIWMKQLRATAVEGYFFSPEAAECLHPVHRQFWKSYYDEGFGPEAALEMDLSGGVGFEVSV